MAFYARPDVPAACIALQDEFGIDVDVLLFVLWCASRGRRLEVSELHAADAAVAPWHGSVVAPIRRVRRALGSIPGGPFDEVAVTRLRGQLLSAELAAERMQHRVLEALAPGPGTADPATAARGNLTCFADRTGIPADAVPLDVLLRAAS